MEFRHKLKALRRERGLTQAALGAMLGYQHTSIANYESGRTSPSIADLMKLAGYFHVSVDYLLCVEPSPETEAFEKDRARKQLLNALEGFAILVTPYQRQLMHEFINSLNT